MYAGKEATVPLPSEGHLHILKNGYVYWENDKRWDPARKQAVDSRRIIGKLDPGHPDRMYPNETYRQLFAPEPGFFSDRLIYGCWAVLRRAAERVGCLEVLREVFPGDWEHIMALACHSICAENSTAQLFPSWAFHNYCGLSHPLSSEEISVVYERIAETPGRVDAFLGGFRQSYHEAFPDCNEVCLAFDSTNQSTEKSNRLATMGHAKRNKGRPQVNTAVFADERTGIPLFYEHFIGSILDKSETPFTVEKAVSLGFRKLFLMMDRGYFSKGTADALTNMGMAFAIMTPGDIRAAQTVIDTHGADFFTSDRNIRQKYYIRGERIYGMMVPDVEILGGRYQAYLYYDFNRNTEERNHILTQLDQMRRQIMARKRYSARMNTTFAPWFTITRCAADPGTGKLFRAVENDSAIEDELARAGFFVITSNKVLSPADIIRAARTRDTDEKVFRRMKWHFGLTSPYTHSLPTYEGKMFMAFVATIIVEAFRWQVRDLLHSSSSATVASLLGEMSKYMVMRKPDGSWMPMYALTRHQKEILNCLELSETTFADNARAISLHS